MGIHPVEEIQIRNGPYPMTSARPAPTRCDKVFSIVQIAHHAQGLVERTNHVLAHSRMVDAGLAAHGRVHLRQTRWWVA